MPLEEAKQSPSGDLSSTEALPGDQAITDPGEIIFSAESDADTQSFLISQMRLNDELSAELSILERRRLQALLRPNYRALDKRFRIPSGGGGGDGTFSIACRASSTFKRE